MKLFFETSPDMLAILDAEGRVLDCNSHFANNAGYEKNEVIGLVAPIDLVAERDRQKAVTGFNEVVKKGINREVNLEVVKKDGTSYPSIWSGASFVDEVGNLEGYIITGKDLSEISKLKEEIQKTKEHSEKEKMMMLGQLTARIAHDIKNPLNVLNMSINLLANQQEQTLSDKRVQDKIETMKKNISRINDQVNIVLDHIRDKPIIYEKIFLNDCIFESIKHIHVPNNVKINQEKTDLSIHGDSLQIGIACSNILNNSIQSFEGEPGEISIKFLEDHEHVTIKVSDSGPGISEDVLPHIFEPLVTTKQSGTGLGLVSSKNIIESHKGIIFANNNPTTFTIKLPKNNL